MKLLFDQNLSPFLVSAIADLFPESKHVSQVSLSQADDLKIWDYAKKNQLVIVSRDSDFSDLSIFHGSPPKVIWLRLGNCSTGQVEMALRDHEKEIDAFFSDTATSLFTLFRKPEK